MNTNKDDLFIDIYTRLHDKLLLNKNKFAHTFDKEFEFEIVKYDDVDTYDYLELHYINENELSTSSCAQYKKVRECIIMFDAYTYVKNILNSYKYDTKRIWDQFDKDLPRTDLFVNTVKIDTRQQFLDATTKLAEVNYAHYANTNTHTNTNINIRKSFDLITICALMSNQSSYMLPYLLMTKIHVDDKEGNNTMISAGMDFRHINITISNSLTFKFDIILGVKYIVQESIKNTIKLNFEISFSMKETTASLNKYGVISWVFE